MKLPGDISGKVLAEVPKRMGYAVTRQTGSHMRLTTPVLCEHHVTIPNYAALRIGTLSSILSEVCEHHRLARETLIEKLFK